MPHLSDHYYQPPMASIPPTSISRSSTLNSIKRMLGFRSNNEADVLNPHRVTSPFMHYVPAPAQFMSPGAVSSDSLMLMSPDYSAVYHPLIVPPQEGTLTLDHNHINNNANVKHDGRIVLFVLIVFFGIDTASVAQQFDDIDTSRCLSISIIMVTYSSIISVSCDRQIVLA